MSPGGQTPEELETLMEDAFVLRDGQALAGLFEEQGVLVAGSVVLQAHGDEQIAEAAAQVWDKAGGYIATPRRIIQSRDTALLVGVGVINVARRGRDRSWRFAISLLDPDWAADRAVEQQPSPPARSVAPAVPSHMPAGQRASSRLTGLTFPRRE
jgi:hypothetical protein